MHDALLTASPDTKSSPTISRRRRAFSRFLRMFLGAVAVLLLLLALFNVLVDPLRIYRIIRSPQLDAVKVCRSGRVYRAQLLLNERWDTIILGSSRAEMGIDPNHAAWRTDRVHNVGLPGISFLEVAAVHDFLQRHVKPRRLVLCVDFHLFNDAGRFSDEFAVSRFNPDLSPIEYHAEALWGWDTTKLSYQALRNRLKGVAPEYDARGLRIKPLAAPDFPPRRSFERSVAREVAGRRQEGPWGNNAKCLAAFERILADCRRNKVELVIVVTPVHAMELEIMQVLGAGPAMEQWRRDLVAAVERESRASGQPAFPLWDFTGYRGYTAEPFPLDPNDRTQMKWYWEPSHFRTSLGDLAICRITGHSPPPGLSIDDFGVRLTPANIEPHLARLRQDREALLPQCGKDLQTIERAARGN